MSISLHSMKHLIGNTRRHDITFNSDGRIEISARVTRALDIHPGDVIDIAVDDRTREVYLYVKHRAPLAGRHKAQCYRTGKGRTCNSLRAHSVEICRKVIDMRGRHETQARLPVGDVIAIDGISRALPIIIRYNANS